MRHTLSIASPIMALSLIALLTLAGCGRSEPDPVTAPAEPEVETAPPESTESTPAEDGPEIIDQADGEQVDPISTTPIEDEIGTAAESAEAEAATDNPLTSLPGFTPTAPTETAADTQAAPGVMQLLVQITAYELTPSTAEDLAPLTQFLSTSPEGVLAPEAVEAMMPLITMLQGRGIVRTVSAPRVLVPSGQQATIEVTQIGVGQVGGLPTARSTLQCTVAPTVRPGATEPDAAVIDMRYALQLAEADSAFEVVAQDLGLNVGSRAGADGTAALTSQHTAFFVRRIVGDDTDRELLVLVRPQAMQADLTK